MENAGTVWKQISDAFSKIISAITLWKTNEIPNCIKIIVIFTFSSYLLKTIDKFYVYKIFLLFSKIMLEYVSQSLQSIFELVMHCTFNSINIQTTRVIL